MSELIWFLTAWTGRAMILGAVAAIVVRTCRLGRAPALERRIWLAVLIAAWVLPMVTLVIRATAPRETMAVLDGLVESALRAAPVAAPPGGSNGWALAFLILWGIGSVLLAGRLIAGSIAAARLRARATVVRSATGRCEIRESPEIAAPVTIGSTVLVPITWPGWPRSTWEAVIHHETGHVRRHDFWWHLLAACYQVAFWWNPLAWWLRHRLSLLAEMLSDDDVLRSGHEASAYAEVLILFGSRSIPLGTALPMSRASSLDTRVARLVEFSEVPISATRPRRVLFGTMGLPALCLALLGPAGRLLAPESGFVLVFGDSPNVVMSGTMADVATARALSDHYRGDYLWFRRGSQSWIIRSPDALAVARSIYAGALRAAEASERTVATVTESDVAEATDRQRRMEALIVAAEARGLAARVR